MQVKDDLKSTLWLDVYYFVGEFLVVVCGFVVRKDPVVVLCCLIAAVLYILLAGNGIVAHSGLPCSSSFFNCVLNKYSSMSASYSIVFIL